MTKLELMLKLKASPIWTGDRWGHYRLTFKDQDYRIKLQDLSVRFERKLGNDWVNRCSDYYRNVEVKDDRLAIKSMRIPLITLPE